MCAKDGSANKYTGTGSWCITLKGQIITYSQIPIDGYHPGSYGAECITLISLLTYLKLLNDKMYITTTSTVHIDCKSIITVTKKLYSMPEQVDRKYRYLQKTIKDLLNSMSYKLTFVRSHQDKRKETLTFEESLNHFCDKKAGEFYKDWEKYVPSNIPLIIPNTHYIMIKKQTKIRKLLQSTKNQQI